MAELNALEQTFVNKLSELPPDKAATWLKAQNTAADLIGDSTTREALFYAERQWRENHSDQAVKNGKGIITYTVGAPPNEPSWEAVVSQVVAKDYETNPPKSEWTKEKVKKELQLLPKDQVGYHALDIAARGNADALEFVEQAVPGTLKAAKEKYNLNLLSIAAVNGHTDAAVYLAKKHPELLNPVITAPGKEGDYSYRITGVETQIGQQNPVHIAVRAHNPETAQALADIKPAMLFERDSRGLTPVDAARLLAAQHPELKSAQKTLDVMEAAEKKYAAEHEGKTKKEEVSQTSGRTLEAKPSLDDVKKYAASKAKQYDPSAPVDMPETLAAPLVALASSKTPGTRQPT